MTDYLNRMSREEIQCLLEENGFAVYDSEPTEKLREALRVNMQDGTIKEESWPTPW